MHKISVIIVRLLMTTFGFISGSVVFAQPKDSSFNDVMRSNDKIYVVMAICITILFGLILYAIRIERKIRKIEMQK